MWMCGISAPLVWRNIKRSQVSALLCRSLHDLCRWRFARFGLSLTHKIGNHLEPQRGAWSTEVGGRTPARSTSLTSCSTGPADMEKKRRTTGEKVKSEFKVARRIQS